MANDAIVNNPNIVNGRSVDIAITTHGSDFYFAICAAMAFTTICIIVASAFKPRTDRIFFYITAGVTMTATIAYFTMGSNLGWVPIDVEFMRSSGLVSGVNREIFYVRYVDWAITTPLLLTDLLLTAGMPWPTILWTIFMDEVMIITGLIGALVRSDYKWGFFTIGCAAMLFVFWNLAWEGRIHAKALGSDIHRVYMSCGVLTLFLWLLYPVSWGLCEGGNVISPDGEAVFYGILDLLAKPGFSILLIWGHWGIKPSRMGLHIRDYDDISSMGDEHHHREKTALAEGAGAGVGGGMAHDTGRSTAIDSRTNGSGVRPHTAGGNAGEGTVEPMHA